MQQGILFLQAIAKQPIGGFSGGKNSECGVTTHPTIKEDTRPNACLLRGVLVQMIT